MNAKKTTSLLFVTLFAASAFSSCSFLGGDSETSVKTDAVTLWSAENTISYMIDDEIPANAALDLSMEALKGETESIQLMITAKEDVSAFNVTVGDLVSSGNKTISNKNIEIFAEKYNGDGMTDYISKSRMVYRGVDTKWEDDTQKK